MSKAVKIPNSYWSLVEPFWLPLNRSWDDGHEAFLRLHRTVAREVGHLYAAHWCQSEVCNGGLYQFFFNTTGLLAPEAAEGFRAIGLTEWAGTLAQAMAFFGSPYPRERAERQKRLPGWRDSPRETWDPFSDLDERCDEWSDRWDEAADAYATRVSAE
jgi:hypothetical protein